MKLKSTLTAVALSVVALSAFAETTVGVSWSNFQEERWKTDEAAIKAQLEKLGAKYISADAAGSPEKQLADIDGLMAKGAKVLIVLAMDKDAILPAVNKAKQQKVPVIAYDRLIEAPGVFYITFDNKEVGRMQARAVLAAAIKKGDVKIVGEEYTDGWKPEVAQKNMEQILTKTGGKVDAVVASNDGMAGGVVAALSSKGLKGIPVSGQDGDFAALNRVATGQQTVSVWKDSRELGKEAATAAVALGAGKKVAGAKTWDGGEKKVALQAQFLKPIPVTKANLDVVLKAGWIKKDELCKGAEGVAACK